MDAMKDAQATNGHASLMERLASAVGSSVHAQSIYGQPVERDGVTVIPVARVRYGFGGGGKKAGTAEGEEGGGAGVQVHPMGFISVRGGSAEFRGIPDPSAEARNLAVLLAGAGLGAWLIFRGIRGLFRR